MDFHHEVDVAAPADTVFDVLLDVESWPEWTRSMKRLERLTPGDLAVGSRVRIHQPYTNARTWVVTDLVRPTTFEWTSRQAGVTLVARHDHVAQDTRTLVRTSVTVGGAIGRLVAPVSAARIRRFLALEAEGLARRAADPSYVAPHEPAARTRGRTRG